MRHARPILPATTPPVSDRPAIPKLRTVPEALERLLAAVVPVADTESVSTLSACGRVLATPLVSSIDVPASDNSQMDGYAVAADDLHGASDASPIDLPVGQRIPAGHPASPLGRGHAARIFTGASIPAGADAVVMQEAVRVDGPDGHARFTSVPRPGAWIRRRGEDIGRGQTVLDAGTRLAPQHLGLAASVGAPDVTVVRRPRVAVFSTGDELAMPGDVAPGALPPGTLFNSNRYTLRGLIDAFGCDVVDLGVVPDRLPETRAALVRAAAGSDCIVTSGGVSVGEEDHMRPAVAAEGRVDFWQIGMKPGKPLAFGRVGETLFVGLPGNPVASFVTFLVFVRPLLMRLQGIADVAPVAYRLRADFEWPRADARQEYLRARTNGDGGLDLFSRQGSGVMTSTAWADGLVENPPGATIARGDSVRFLPFASLIG